MKELSPEKKLRLEKLELLTYDVEVGNTHIVRKVKGKEAPIGKTGAINL